MNLFIDINSGEVRRTLSGPVLPCLKFYINDIVPLVIVLTDSGTAVTAANFGIGTVLQAALRGYPLTANPLVSTQTFTLSGENASGKFDLTAQALADYFTANVPAGALAWAFVFEVQVSASDGSTKQTLSQIRALVARDLNTVIAPVVVTLGDDQGNDIGDSSGNTLSST